MRNLIRLYKQNKILVWGVILGLIMFKLVLNWLNEYYKQNPNNSQTNTVSIYDNKNYFVVSEKSTPSDVNIISSNIITQFFDYCNSGKTAEAYSLLSDECKSTLYNSLDKFINSYYKNIFNGNKRFTMQAWIVNNENSSCTYKVNITENILQTRKYEFKQSNRRILYNCYR